MHGGAGKGIHQFWGLRVLRALLGICCCICCLTIQVRSAPWSFKRQPATNGWKRPSSTKEPAMAPQSFKDTNPTKSPPRNQPKDVPHQISWDFTLKTEELTFSGNYLMNNHPIPAQVLRVEYVGSMEFNCLTTELSQAPGSGQSLNVLSPGGSQDQLAGQTGQTRLVQYRYRSSDVNTL